LRDCGDKGAWLLPALLREQPQAPETGMPFAADHQVIVNGNAQRIGRLPDLARHLDVVARWLGIATWMIVQEPNVRLTALISLYF
jgi:hypothetical protein